MNNNKMSADDKGKIITAIVGLGAAVLTSILNSVIKSDEER